MNQRFIAAAQAAESDRADFIRLTYLHLGVAVLAFAGLTALLINSPFAPAMMELLATSPYSWLVVLGGFMAVGWIADRWARSSTSMGMQYAGLALYVVAEAVLFVPLLFIAANYAGPDVIPTAGLLTAVVFTGLTGTVFITKKDFSFLGRFLMIATFAAIGFIVAAILFDFSLGLLFSTAMVLLAAGYILFYTSNVLHHYPVGSHVAAALALFAAVALLFWYILQLVMAFGRD
ncbi:MAG: Bax inhibitor-1 family protein [Myxococcota bacterium]